jgi:hypothetical protein
MLERLFHQARILGYNGIAIKSSTIASVPVLPLYHVYKSVQLSAHTQSSIFKKKTTQHHENLESTNEPSTSSATNKVPTPPPSASNTRLKTEKDKDKDDYLVISANPEEEGKPITELDQLFVERDDEASNYAYCITLLRTVVWVPMEMSKDGKLVFFSLDLEFENNVIPVFDTKKRMLAALPHSKVEQVCSSVPFHVLLETIEPDVNGIIVNPRTSFCDYFDKERLAALKDTAREAFTNDDSVKKQKRVVFLEDPDNILEPFRKLLTERLALHKDVYRAYLEYVAEADGKEEPTGDPYLLLLLEGKPPLSQNDIDFIGKDIGICMQMMDSKDVDNIEFDIYDPIADEPLTPFYNRKPSKSRVSRVKYVRGGVSNRDNIDSDAEKR